MVLVRVELKNNYLYIRLSYKLNFVQSSKKKKTTIKSVLDKLKITMYVGF